ncbi:hypothetical protein BDV98DRAFT_570177 [Pterulicium gracile]|uniref:Uncharacterized protein n=1 Tax=Pterulicium gracile TaxID=1884261 RepID=A0A5C3QCL8_9AGAR|nr:hypothetical protein BDV98DRAFT_570177 [Pterula gracilis]
MTSRLTLTSHASLCSCDDGVSPWPSSLLPTLSVDSYSPSYSPISCEAMWGLRWGLG